MAEDSGPPKPVGATPFAKLVPSPQMRLPKRKVDPANLAVWDRATMDWREMIVTVLQRYYIISSTLMLNIRLA